MYYVEIRAIEVGSEIACGLAIDSTPPRLSCPRNLESNQLTGLLPIQWSRLTNLQHLNYLALEGEPCAADARERDPTLRRNHLIT